jgi:transcriptional regulator with XRE-family HTH domain
MSTDPSYRTDLINAAMGARRLTNKAVAEKAGVGVMTVSKIRNGNPAVGYLTLKKVVEALGLTMAEVSSFASIVEIQSPQRAGFASESESHLGSGQYRER